MRCFIYSRKNFGLAEVVAVFCLLSFLLFSPAYAQEFDSDADALQNAPDLVALPLPKNKEKILLLLIPLHSDTLFENQLAIFNSKMRSSLSIDDRLEMSEAKYVPSSIGGMPSRDCIRQPGCLREVALTSAGGLICGGTIENRDSILAVELRLVDGKHIKTLAIISARREFADDPAQAFDWLSALLAKRIGNLIEKPETFGEQVKVIAIGEGSASDPLLPFVRMPKQGAVEFQSMEREAQNQPQPVIEETSTPWFNMDLKMGYSYYASHRKVAEEGVNPRHAVLVSVSLNFGGEGFIFELAPQFSHQTTSGDFSEFNLIGSYLGFRYRWLKMGGRLVPELGWGIRGGYLFGPELQHGFETYARVPVGFAYYIHDSIAFVMELGLNYGIIGLLSGEGSLEDVASRKVCAELTGDPELCGGDSDDSGFRFAQGFQLDLMVGVRFP